jgi:phosphatidate cytidylyltransferase
MANFYLYIQILLFYFAFAAGLFYLAGRRNEWAVKRALWKKYIVYFFLVFLVMFVFYAGPLPTLGFFIILQAVAVMEWWLTSRQLRLSVQLISGGFLSIVLVTPYFSFPLQEEFLSFYFFVIIFDGFSQAFGQWLKGPKMIHSVSPNKTWSGFIGGWMMVVVARYFLVDFGLEIGEITLYSFVALIGDLLASGFKRVAQIKDFPTSIPGHGGVLDRFDSFFFVIFVMTLFKCLSYV